MLSIDPNELFFRKFCNIRYINNQRRTSITIAKQAVYNHGMWIHKISVLSCESLDSETTATWLQLQNYRHCIKHTHAQSLLHSIMCSHGTSTLQYSVFVTVNSLLMYISEQQNLCGQPQQSAFLWCCCSHTRTVDYVCGRIWSNASSGQNPNESQFVLAIFIRYIFISCFVSGWACEVCRALYNSSFQLWGPVQPTSSVLKSHTSCFITVLFPKPLFVLLQQNKQALNVLYNIAWFTDPLMRDGEEQTQGLIIYSIATSPVVARRPSRTWS